MRRWFFAFVLFFVGSPAWADLKMELALCARVPGDLDRLTCFDKVAKSNGLNGPQPIPVDDSDIGKWSVRKDKNPIDDSVRVVAILQADEGQSRFGEPIDLIVRCQSNQTELYINWNNYLGDDSNDVYSDWKYVTTRVGNSEASTSRWGISTDSKATFAPGWAGKLLKEMVQSDRFLAQTTPYSESPVIAIFDTRGMRKALSPLVEACGWSLD